MADQFTELNLGSGGDFMDESAVTYPDVPNLRKRARVVLTGDDDKDKIVEVTNTSPESTDYGIVTRPLPPDKNYSGTALFEFGTVTTVPSQIETTVTTYTVPVGKTSMIHGFVASGDMNAKFTLYLDGNPGLVSRSSVAGLNVAQNFLGITPVMVEGKTVSVKVIHGNDGLQGNFDATIIGQQI